MNTIDGLIAAFARMLQDATNTAHARFKSCRCGGHRTSSRSPATRRIYSSTLSFPQRPPHGTAHQSPRPLPSDTPNLRRLVRLPSPNGTGFCNALAATQNRMSDITDGIWPHRAQQTRYNNNVGRQSSRYDTPNLRQLKWHGVPQMQLPPWPRETARRRNITDGIWPRSVQQT